MTWNNINIYIISNFCFLKFIYFNNYNMKIKDTNPIRNRINLFMRIIIDFQSYRVEPDEKDNIFSIPKNTKSVLRETLQSQIISDFIENVQNERLEKSKHTENQKLKRKLTLKKKEEDETVNLFNYKKYKNISCFGQRTIHNLNQYFNSMNETEDVIENITNDIFSIDKEAFFTFVDILKGNTQKESAFLFINPDYYNSVKSLLNDRNKRKYYSNLDEYKELLMVGDKKFASLDNYYKFVKNEMEEDKNNINNPQYDMFIKEMDKRKNEKKNKKLAKLPLLYSPMNSTRDIKQNNNNNTQIKKAYENLCNLPNVGLLNVIYRNKNIKDELYKSKVKQGIIKNKNKLYLSDYDYNNVLDIKSTNTTFRVTKLNVNFHKFYNTQIYKKK